MKATLRSAALFPALGLVLVLVVAPACDLAPDASVLLEADRQFAADVASGGPEAWVGWFAEDGAMIEPGVGELRGHDAIRGAVGYLDDPDVSLEWSPDRARIAASGDMGWTTGPWSFRPTPDGPVATRGRYVSIWERQADGSWKVVMDLGNPIDDEG